MYTFGQVATVKKSNKAKKSTDTTHPFNSLTAALAKEVALKDIREDKAKNRKRH